MNDTMEWLAVYPHAWARGKTERAARRKARENVPSYLKDRSAIAVLRVWPNDDGEFPYVDQAGGLRVPDGARWETKFNRQGRTDG